MILRLLRQYAPPADALLNFVANHLPYVAWRMRVYRAFGVTLTDPRSGVIMLGTEVLDPEHLTLGRRSIVGRGCLLDARGGIEIGDDVNISSYSRLMTAKHVVDDPEFPAAYGRIVIERRAWIAMGATVLDGVTVGEGAVVTANATVTRDVPPFAIVAGTPAKVIGERRQPQTYELGYRPNWL
jgi:acetyltransferase-like isoleucine patch superfamily enzyme